MTETEADFTIPDEVLSLRQAMMEAISDDAAAFVGLAMETHGMAEDEACTVVVDFLIKYAASIAMKVRRDVQKGEPRYERWRALTDAAYERALTEEPTRDAN